MGVYRLKTAEEERKESTLFNHNMTISHHCDMAVKRVLQFQAMLCGDS